MSDDKIRTRYAPSPTGLQHPGGVRTALFAWAFARSSSGDFILRIEDTDKEREVEEAEEYIYESLKWLGADWDEGPDVGGSYGPYRQSERLDIYQKYAQELIDKGLAYADPYTKEEVDGFRKEAQNSKQAFLFRNFRPDNPPKWQPGMPLRFKVGELKSYTWEDITRGKSSAGPESLDDFVILKSDGYPTYNFANVIDDHLMEITHVLRGEEYISSIPKYLSLYEAFSWQPPINVTMPLVLGKDGGKKLSKRDGSLPMLEYKDLGYLPAAVINFLVTLGWNDGTEQEIFSVDELLEKFDINRLQKAPARFDIERLNYLNGVHIRQMSIEELYTLTAEYWPEPANKYDDEYRINVLKLIHERLKYLSEIPELTSFFFETPKVADLSDEEKSWIKQAAEKLEGCSFELDCLEGKLRGLADSLEVGHGKLFMAMRQAVTGSKVSPGLFETMNVLGKEEVLKRLAKY